MIRDSARYDATRHSGGSRINLGCGHIPLNDYLNVDRRDLPRVDIVAEAGALPFEPGSVAEIFSSHMIEHFPQEDMRRRLLPYWLGLLRPGGVFHVITPDAEDMLARAAAGQYEFAQFRESLFGAQDYEGDYHYNLFSPDSLMAMLGEAGFHDPKIVARGRKNGSCYEFEVTAIKL